MVDMPGVWCKSVSFGGMGQGRSAAWEAPPRRPRVAPGLSKRFICIYIYIYVCVCIYISFYVCMYL